MKKAKKDIAIKENHELQSYDKVTGEVIEKFLFTFPDSFTKEEKELFKALALANNLNPFKREIHPVKFTIEGKKVFNVITGYQVYLQRAEQTGRLDGWKVDILYTPDVPRGKRDNKGKPIYIEGAKITIYRKDFQYPFEWIVSFEEFYANNKQWRRMPEFMIKKVAIGQGMRLAFPNELGALPYLREELDRGIIDDVENKTSDSASNNEDVQDAEYEDLTGVERPEGKPPLGITDIKKKLEIPKKFKDKEVAILDFIIEKAQEFNITAEEVLESAVKRQKQFWNSFEKWFKEEPWKEKKEEDKEKKQKEKDTSSDNKKNEEKEQGK